MRRVDHINIDVNDLKACVPFYQDVLDFDLLRPPADFQGEHAMFEAGETVVTLVESGRADGWDGVRLDHPLDKAHVAFETDREHYARLLTRLADQFPKQGPYDWGEFEGFYFHDPDGNLLEAISYERPTPDTELLTHDDVE